MFGRHGLPLSLYTDRGSHYFHTPEAGGKVDRDQPTQVGRALAQLSIEHIAAYSPQARGRSERLFGTLQGRVPKELTLAGITTVAEANARLRETYIAAHNARFATTAEQEGSAFVAVPGLDLAEVLCVEEERVVGNDNCVSFLNRKLQIPASPLRPHFVRATVKVHQYPDGGLAVFHGRRCLGRYDSKGVPVGEPRAQSPQSKDAGPSRRQARAVLGAVKDASRRDAVTSPAARSSLTAPPRRALARRVGSGEMVLTVSQGNGRRRHRSRAQNTNERPHDVSPKPANLICSRHWLSDKGRNDACSWTVHSWWP